MSKTKDYKYSPERVAEIVAILSDGIPRTYIELGAAMGLTNVQVYNIVRSAIDSGNKDLVFRQFRKSNRHYVMNKRAVLKLGGLWNTELINSPVTFAVLAQMGEVKTNVRPLRSGRTRTVS
jgi:hypothetical protein